MGYNKTTGEKTCMRMRVFFVCWGKMSEPCLKAAGRRSRHFISGQVMEVMIRIRIWMIECLLARGKHFYGSGEKEKIK